MTQIDQLVESLGNAIRYEAARTKGIDATMLLEYKIGLVIMNGDITGYTMERVDVSENQDG